MKRLLIIILLLIAIPAFARMMGGTMGSLIGAGTTTTDHFTYSDGELGTVSSANWERWDTNAADGYINVLSGKIKYESGFGGWYVEKTTYLSSSVYSQITIDTIAAGMSVGLYVNAAGKGDTTCDGYVLNIWDDGGTKTLEIYEILNNGWTLISASDTTTSYAAGDIFRLANESGTLKAYKNGALISALNIADATYTAARVGIFIDSTGAATRLDNWEGGDVR